MTDAYKIGPYNDGDVQQVLSELLADDSFIDAVGKFRFNGWYPFVSPFVKRRIRTFLTKKSQSIRSIRDFQLVVESQLSSVLSKTTEAFTVSGLNHLDSKKAYLYLGNHRDIAMDPALVNLALHNGGFDTVRIAIGDNLIKEPFIGQLMRLNKSFIVRRDISGPREMLQTYSELSNYIRESITEGHSIWIAQREGRAKDGIDKTDPAILKMLSISGKSAKEPFKETINALNVVPVSISYEFDPCAPMKARELSVIDTEGSYTKRPGEDVKSIATGIMGWKGRVHLHFGKPIDSAPETPVELAPIIDSAIIRALRIFDTSRIAASILEKQPNPDDVLIDVSNRFTALINQTPIQYRTKLLEIYANPLKQFTRHQNEDYGL